MSFLDKIKDKVLGMFDSKVIEEINKQADNYDQKQDKLIQDLEKAKSDYIERTTLGDKISVDLKRLNNQDITKIAKSILDQTYDTKKSELTKQYNQAVNNANKNLEEVKKRAEESIKQAEFGLKENIQKIDSKGMKNNIARSSAVELSKQKLNDDTEQEKTALAKVVNQAQLQKEKEVEDALTQKEKADEKIEKAYQANLTAKENELKDLRDSTSEYDNEYVDKREATNYSNELVSLVTEFALSLPKETRQIFFDQNKQIKNILSEDELNYVKQMVLS